MIKKNLILWVPIIVYCVLLIGLAAYYQVTEFQVINRIIKLEERMNEAERVNRAVD